MSPQEEADPSIRSGNDAYFYGDETDECEALFPEKKNKNTTSKSKHANIRDTQAKKKIHGILHNKTD